jgi:hypothetical protein
MLLQATSGSGCAAGDAVHYYAHALVADFLQQQQSKCRLPWQGSSGAAMSDSKTKHLAFLLLGYGLQPLVHLAEQQLGVQPSDGRAVHALHYLWHYADGLISDDDGQLCTGLGMMYRYDGQYTKAEPMLRQVPQRS